MIQLVGGGEMSLRDFNTMQNFVANGRVQIPLAFEKLKNATSVQIAWFFKKVALELFKRVVQKTPVDTGLLRGSWNPTVGMPSASMGDYYLRNHIGKSARFYDGQPQDSEELAKALSVMSGFKNSDDLRITHFSNAMPYARKIEFEGHSRLKAPQGMMTLSVMEVVAWAGSI